MKRIPQRNSPNNWAFYCPECGCKVWFCTGMNNKIKKAENAFCNYKMCPYCGATAEGTETKEVGQWNISFRTSNTHIS